MALPVNHSRFWYALPVFLGIIGGLIMYAKLRTDDPKMAKDGLILGIIMTVVYVLATNLLPTPIGLYVGLIVGLIVFVYMVIPDRKISLESKKSKITFILIVAFMILLSLSPVLIHVKSIP